MRRDRNKHHNQQNYPTEDRGGDPYMASGFAFQPLIRPNDLKSM